MSGFSELIQQPSFTWSDIPRCWDPSFKIDWLKRGPKKGTAGNSGPWLPRSFRGASAELPRKSGFEPDFQQGGKDRAGHDRKDRSGQEGLGKGRKERAGAGKKGQVKGMPKCTPTYMIVNLHAFRGLSNGLYWQLGSLRRKSKVRYGVVMGVVMEALWDPGTWMR